MEKVLGIFSKYELKARIFPAFLVLAPLIFSVAIWYPEIIALEASILTGLIIVVILFYFAKFARDFGFKKQKKLLKEWNGFPTTRYLSHLDDTIDPITKSRYHNYLSSHLEELIIPSPEDELESPGDHEKFYGSAVKWLLENTRENNLLLQDNINYGFSRNMLGIKFLGFIFTSLSLLVNLFGIYQSYKFEFISIPLKIWIAVLISLIFLYTWIFLVNKEWVKRNAEAYARTLLSTCESKR